VVPGEACCFQITVPKDAALAGVLTRAIEPIKNRLAIPTMRGLKTATTIRPFFNVLMKIIKP
jgi:hypothetical protein